MAQLGLLLKNYKSAAEAAKASPMKRAREQPSGKFNIWDEDRCDTNRILDSD